MRRCVWYRKLKNEEAMAHVGSQRHGGWGGGICLIIIEASAENTRSYGKRSIISAVSPSALFSWNVLGVLIEGVLFLQHRKSLMKSVAYLVQLAKNITSQRQVVWRRRLAATGMCMWVSPNRVWAARHGSYRQNYNGMDYFKDHFTLSDPSRSVAGIPSGLGAM